LPLIRHLSARLTPLLLGSPFSANQITAASLVAGLAASACMLAGAWAWAVAGGVFLVVGYVLDNCDGEIARLKGQSSEFGRHFDTFVDWVVHTAFFAALGFGVAVARGADVWQWLGWIAAAGGTINYGVGLLAEVRRRPAPGPAGDGSGPATAAGRRPEGWSDWAIYAFRELSRADFCFIVLALAAFDVTWVLLPMGALSAQVYWLTQFVRGAKDFRV
jgi:phosphatidylglycerophosphate synthase